MLQMRAATDLPKRIVFKPTDLAEAERQIAKYQAQGFVIVERSEGEVVLNPPDRGDDIMLIRALDETGDARIVWSRKDQAQVSEARKKFQEYVKKGYTAYVCRLDGSKGAKVDSFDALMEEIIMVERSRLASVPERKPPAPAPKPPAPRGAQGVLVPPTSPS